MAEYFTKLSLARVASSLASRRLSRLGRLARSCSPYLLFGTAIYLLARPLLAVGHELVLFLAAELLARVALSGAMAALNGQIPLDPVYTNSLFLLLSDVDVSGVAVALPLGALLHAGWPALFTSPELVADGAWSSAVVEPGASLIARGLTSLTSDVIYLALGLVLVRVGLSVRWRPTWRGRRGLRLRWLAVSGALLQAHVALNHLAASTISVAELEATGLTYGFSVLFSGPAAERPRLSAVLSSLPEPFRDAVLPLAAVALAYGLALVLVHGPWLAWRLLTSWRRRPRVFPVVTFRLTSPCLLRLALARLGLVIFALTVAASPIGSLAASESRYLAESYVAEVVEAEPSGQDGPTFLAVEKLESASRAGPAHSPAELAVPTVPSVRTIPPPAPVVTVSGSRYQYSYQVGGQREVIRGMGYNPVYAHLPADERARLYDRDFSSMRQAEVNTILGWVSPEFDDLLLDKAHEHGLGVILPYDLSPDLDYTDTVVREAVWQDVLGWVVRYKDHPALRMWGIGNEVLHKLVFPSWMKVRGDPVLERRADAFADFYVALVEQVHQLDPNHPVTYRDAEDAYLPRLRDALNRGGAHREWFVYGVNIYTPRLRQVLDNWPAQGLDAALLVSEFAPGGAGPSERPAGYREMWSMVRAHDTEVIGGAPYVWTTNGPEEVDRIFGLVDASGQPVDGSLAEIGRFYRGEAAIESEQQRQDVGRQCDERVSTLAWRTIQELQANSRQPLFQASSPPTVMGQLDNLPADTLRAEDLRFERAAAPARQAWQRASGFGAEWWATWSPPSRPGSQLGLLIRERAGQVEVAYVYHGPASPGTGWSC